MILRDYLVFDGEHCETTAIGNIMQFEGLALSEPMLFGIGGGLGYIYWNMKTMPVPFLGGRSKEIVSVLCKNLKVDLDVKETTSEKKAWANVERRIRSGHPVGLQLDSFYLDYFTSKIHFAGHHVAMYGYDEEYAYLNDISPQGGLIKTSLQSLGLARNEKGPMSARNKSYSITSLPKTINFWHAISSGIKKSAEEFLNPPITNMGYKGILKTSQEIKKWLNTIENPSAAFRHTATMMEKAGTGGALFRSMYSKFLGEAYAELKIDALENSRLAFRKIADRWTNVSDLFIKYSDTENESYIYDASDILAWLSDAEKAAFEVLATEFI